MIYDITDAQVLSCYSVVAMRQMNTTVIVYKYNVQTTIMFDLPNVTRYNATRSYMFVGADT